MPPAHPDVMATDHALLCYAVKKKIAADVIQKDEELKKKFPLVKKQQAPVAVAPPVSPAVSGTVAYGG